MCASSQLSPSWRGLLITLDYRRKKWPAAIFHRRQRGPGPVPGRGAGAIIDRRDILDKEPKFQAAGVSRLDTVVYRLGQQRA